MSKVTRYLNAIVEMIGAQPPRWRPQADPYPYAEVMANGDVRIQMGGSCTSVGTIVLDMAFTLSLADWLIDTYGEKESP